MGLVVPNSDMFSDRFSDSLNFFPPPGKGFHTLHPDQIVAEIWRNPLEQNLL